MCVCECVQTYLGICQLANRKSSGHSDEFDIYSKCLTIHNEKVVFLFSFFSGGCFDSLPILTKTSCPWHSTTLTGNWNCLSEATLPVIRDTPVVNIERTRITLSLRTEPCRRFVKFNHIILGLKSWVFSLKPSPK